MKKEINLNQPLQAGDVIELHFRTTGMLWIQAAQIALIENRVENNSRFEILSHSLFNDQTLVFKCKVKQTNPVVVTAAVIGAVIIGAGVIAWLTLDKVYQLVDSPAGKIAVGGIGTLALAAGIAALLALGSTKK